MGKKMNLIHSLMLLNKNKELWLWPSCKHPKTLSFRATINDAVFLNPKGSHADADVELTTLDSCFTNSSESASISSESEKYFDNNECSSVETIVREARSDRLFFEPGPTSSILETLRSDKECMEEKIGGGDGGLPYKESVAMVMDSENPYGDFKKSMEEMVEIHGLKDWDRLEELLGWYLRMNAKNNHEFIVGAFVDLLAGINGGGGSSGDGGGGGSCSERSRVSFTSVGSTFPSPVSYTLSQSGSEKEITEEEKMVTK